MKSSLHSISNNTWAEMSSSESLKRLIWKESSGVLNRISKIFVCDYIQTTIFLLRDECRRQHSNNLIRNIWARSIAMDHLISLTPDVHVRNSRSKKWHTSAYERILRSKQIPYANSVPTNRPWKGIAKETKTVSYDSDKGNHSIIPNDAQPREWLLDNKRKKKEV